MPDVLNPGFEILPIDGESQRAVGDYRDGFPGNPEIKDQRIYLISMMHDDTVHRPVYRPPEFRGYGRSIVGQDVMGGMDEYRRTQFPFQDTPDEPVEYR